MHTQAIYPTIVIVIVALDRSHFELGLASSEAAARKSRGRMTLDGSEDSDGEDEGSKQAFTASQSRNEGVERGVWIS